MHRKIKQNKQVEDATCELMPSHISFWEAYNELKLNFPDCNDSRYIMRANGLYHYLATYLGEINALMQFIINSGIIGRAKRHEIIKAMDKSSFLNFNTKLSFNPHEVNVWELIRLNPVYSELAIKYIRQEMKDCETLSEYEDSSVGFNLDCFLKENFDFYNQKYNSFKNGEYKYFSKLCELITKIKEDKRGGQKNSYALLYLFFPVDIKQNTHEDLLIDRRLNEKYLQWKNEPKNTEEAFQRLVKYFPTLLNYQTNGQPSFPSRSRDAIGKWINDGQTWLTNFIRDIWTPLAIEKSGFKTITSVT